jgi:ACS family hexuronate transporter-like MFS transporter
VTAFVADPSDPDSGPYHWLLLCRTLLGLFEAGHWPCALLTVRQILSDKDRPLGNGILQSGASLGAILIPFYVLLVRHLGGSWEVVFWTIGAAGLLWVPLWLVLVRRGDLVGRATHANDATTTRFEWKPFLRMFAALAIVVSCLNVSWQFIRAWLPKYLKESQGFSADSTDLVVMGYYIAADLGCLASGFLVKWLVRRGRGVHPARLIGFATFAAVTVLAALVPVVGGGWVGVALLILAGAGILGLHPFYYALVQELPARNMGFLSGVLAAAGWVVVGFMQKEMGARIEATKSYDLGFVIVGLAPLVGLIALVVLWKPEQNRTNHGGTETQRSQEKT